MTLTAKDLKLCQGKTRSTLRSQRPRLFADYKKHLANKTAPTNVNVPVIMGTPQVGHTLECTMGNWNGAPTAYGAQWLRNAAAIPGATFAKYLVVAGDVGHPLTVNVTAYTGGGQATVSSSAVTPN
jgi:hypothetical protein